MKRGSYGYATIVTCLLLPVVILGLGLVTFSLVKTRHVTKMQSVCHQQYHDYFSNIKTQLATIEIYKASAISLYQTQQLLLPMIWMPPALKLYRLVLSLRKKLEHLQNLTIKLFNRFNLLNSVKTFAAIQRILYRENKKIRNTLEHQSLATYKTDPKLQIIKKMNILFPPYEPHPEIEQRQMFKVTIKNNMHPKSWIHFFSVPRLNEIFLCSATLVVLPHDKIKISYDI